MNSTSQESFIQLSLSYFVWSAGDTDMASLLKKLIGKLIQLYLPLR